MSHLLETILPGFTPSRLQQAAIDRIEYFTQKLKEDYGFYVRSAMELEFFVEDGKGNPVEAAINLRRANTYLKTSMSAPYIQKIDYETRNRNDIDEAQYEVNIADKVDVTHIGKARDYSPVAVAAVTHRLKHHLVADMLKQTSSLTPPRFLEPNFAPRPYLHRQLIPGERDRGRSTSALHTNVSLCDHKGVNLFNLSQPLFNHCINSMLRLHYETALAVMPTPESTTRLGANGGTPEAIRVNYNRDVGIYPASISMRRYKDVDDPGRWHETRIENRLPGADADPFVSMAISVAALYEAVTNNVIRVNEITRKVKPTGNPFAVKKPFFTEAQETAEQRHQLLAERFGRKKSHEHLRDLLGDDLYNAIRDEYDKNAVVTR